MAKQAQLVQTQNDYAVVDLLDNTTTIYAGPCMFYGVHVNTVLSAHTVEIQDGTTAKRTNLVLQSEDFGTTWANTSTDEPTTNNTAPAVVSDGATNADEVATTSTADIAFAIYQDLTGLTATNVTTVSCYIKLGTGTTFVQLCWDDAGGKIDGCFCNFNLSTGVTGTATALTAGTVVGATIQHVGNDWYRCTLTGSIAVGTTARFNIAFSDAIDSAVLATANMTNNDSLILWGAQVEVASAVTDYIPTTTVVRFGSMPPVVLKSQLAANTNLQFPGIRLENGLIVNPNDASTGNITVFYRPVNPSFVDGLTAITPA